MTTPKQLVPAGRTLGVIGAGVMGQTLMKGLIDAGLIAREQVWAVERTEATRDDVRARLGVEMYGDYRDAPATAGIVLLVCEAVAGRHGPRRRARGRAARRTRCSSPSWRASPRRSSKPGSRCRIRGCAPCRTRRASSARA